MPITVAPWHRVTAITGAGLARPAFDRMNPFSFFGFTVFELGKCRKSPLSRFFFYPEIPPFN
jgi:hypothetical protein